MEWNLSSTKERVDLRKNWVMWSTAPSLLVLAYEGAELVVLMMFVILTSLRGLID